MNKNFPGGESAPLKRDKSIDILKGIAIVLVVYAHTRPFCTNFIYSFNLPVFFMCSGYCFKKRICNLNDLRSYIAGKMRTLYLPCAVYNGIFALLSGLFLRLGFYTDNPTFLTMTKDWPVPQKLHVINGVSDILYKFIRVILLTDTTQMGTGTWAILALFLISVIHGTSCIFLSKLTPNNRRFILITTIVFLAVLLQFVIPTYGKWWMFKCFMFCIFTYCIGLCLKMANIRLTKKLPVLLLSVFILLLITPFYFVDLANGSVGDVYMYLPGILAGWFMLKIISEQLAEKEAASRVFSYLGRNTIPIICLHVLCFKLVTWLYIKVSNLPEIYLASFHIDFDVSWSWKLLYLLTGVVIPVILTQLWKRFLYNRILNALKTDDHL